MLSLTVFSQKDTLGPTKDLPISTLKLIVKDLLKGDQCLEELRLTNIQLSETEKKVILKDSVIGKMNLIINSKDSIIIFQNQKFDIMKEQAEKLEKALKKQKMKGIFSRISSFAIVGTLTYFLIRK